MRFILCVLALCFANAASAELLTGVSVTPLLNRPLTELELTSEQNLATENALSKSKNVIYWLRSNVKGDSVTKDLRRFLPVLGELKSVKRSNGPCELVSGECIYTEVKVVVNPVAMTQALTLIQDEAKLDDYLDYYIDNPLHPANSTSKSNDLSFYRSSQYLQILALFTLKEIQQYYQDAIIYVDPKTATRGANDIVHYRFAVHGHFSDANQLENSIQRVFEVLGISVKKVERLVRQGSVNTLERPVMNFERGNQLNVGQVCFIPTSTMPNEFSALMAGDTVLTLPLMSGFEYVRVGDNDTQEPNVLFSDSGQLCFWRSFGLDFYTSLHDGVVANFKYAPNSEQSPKLHFQLELSRLATQVITHASKSVQQQIKRPAPPAMEPEFTQWYDSEILVGCLSESKQCKVHAF